MAATSCFPSRDHFNALLIAFVRGVKPARSTSYSFPAHTHTILHYIPPPHSPICKPTIHFPWRSGVILCHKLHQLTLEGWRGTLGGAIGSGRDIKTKGLKSNRFTANNLCDWCTFHLLCYLSVPTFTGIKGNWLQWILCLMRSHVTWLFQVDTSMLV